MWLRRTYLWAQVIAVVALPVWIVVARSMAPVGLGAQDVLVFLSWPLLGIALLVHLALTWARKLVRDTRAVSWTDVVVLTVWWAASIAYGVFISQSASLATGLTGGLLLVVSIAGTAVAVYELVVAARLRVATVLADLDRRTAIPGQSVSMGRYEATRIARGDGPVIRIDGSDAP